jgi:hypothetical protein
MEPSSSLPALKLPGIRIDQEDQEEKEVMPERGMISTPTFFPTNLEKLKRENAILDAVYEIPARTRQPTCLVSIVSHVHGQIPVVIYKTKSKVKDANFIVKTVPNGNTLSTRLLAPAGVSHEEVYAGNVVCPTYSSSLRIIYVSRMRLFSNLQCLPQVHFKETQKERFVPRDYYNEDLTKYSEKGLAQLTKYNFIEYMDDPNYCKYFSEKTEYIEKVFSISPSLSAPIDETLFGIYIDIAIIEPKVDDETTSIVKVKTFILSNTSEEFMRASHAYIELLIGERDEKIKQELEEFIESGTCKLSTIIEAISSYTKKEGVPDGNTKLFLTDLSCSVYNTFDDTPRKSKSSSSINSNDLDDYNEEIKSKLLEDYNINKSRADVNEAGTGYLYYVDDNERLLTFREIEGKRLSKDQMKKQEYNKMIEILTSKLPDLRNRVAAGFIDFNKTRRHRTKRYRTKKRTTKRRRTKRRTKMRRGKK